MSSQVQIGTVGASFFDNFAGQQDTDWTNGSNVGNVGGSLAQYASISIVFPDYESWYIGATHFGFSIPGGATIDGIKVEFFSRSVDNSAFAIDMVLIRAGVADDSTHQAPVPTLPTSFGSVPGGGATDLWGAAWTDADINSASFGAGFSVASNDSNADVSYCQITVYYTGGGGGSTVDAAADVSSTGAIVASGLAKRTVIANVSSTGHVISSASAKRTGSVSVSGTGSLTISAAAKRTGSVQVSGTGSVGAIARATRGAGAVVAASTVISALASIKKVAGCIIGAEGELLVSFRRVRPGTFARWGVG